MKKTLLVLVTVLMTVALFISCGNDPFFHYVDFDSDGGTSVERQIVADGEKATKPADPTKDGVTFDNWYDGDTAFDFNTAIKGDTVLKAKWKDSGTTPVTPAETKYTVTYYNGTDLVETVEFKENETVTIRDVGDLQKGKLAFVGWSATQGSETAEYLADSEYKENKSITLYAVWSSKITITYKDTKSEAADKEVEWDVTTQTPTLLAAEDIDWTTPTGFVLDGWYTQDKGEGTYFAAGAGINESLVLYAHWIDENVEVDDVKKNVIRVNSAKTKADITSIEIPSVYHGKAITAIADNGFAECSGLTEVTFEKAENITSIGMSVFRQCTALKKIDLSGTSVTTAIEQSVFSGCTSLAEVILPTNLTKLSTGLFYGCTALKSITLPSTLTSIANSAFEQSGLESITIPKSVKTLEMQAFQDCKALKSVVINGEIETLEDYTFRRCSALESVTLPGTLKSINGDSVFTGCTSLKNITINKDEASTSITGLKSCDIPTTTKIDYADTLRVIFDSDGGSFVAPAYPDASTKKVTAPTAPTKEGYVFYGWYKEDGNLFDFDTKVTEVVRLKAKWGKEYSVGKPGPAGGTVFYVADSLQTTTYKDSDGKDVTYTWRYLEVAPIADAVKVEFGEYKDSAGKNVKIVTTGNEAIGTGHSNTRAIVNAMGTTTDYAARKCDEYTKKNEEGVVYDDWFLPSKEEFQQLISANIPNISSIQYYWTSSESNIDNEIGLATYYQTAYSSFNTSSKGDGGNVALPIRAF